MRLVANEACRRLGTRERRLPAHRALAQREERLLRTVPAAVAPWSGAWCSTANGVSGSRGSTDRLASIVRRSPSPPPPRRQTPPRTGSGPVPRGRSCREPSEPSPVLPDILVGRWCLARDLCLRAENPFASLPGRTLCKIMHAVCSRRTGMPRDFANRTDRSVAHSPRARTGLSMRGPDLASTATARRNGGIRAMTVVHGQGEYAPGCLHVSTEPCLKERG